MHILYNFSDFLNSGHLFIMDSFKFPAIHCLCTQYISRFLILPFFRFNALESIRISKNDSYIECINKLILYNFDSW